MVAAATRRRATREEEAPRVPRVSIARGRDATDVEVASGRRIQAGSGSHRQSHAARRFRDCKLDAPYPAGRECNSGLHTQIASEP